MDERKIKRLLVILVMAVVAIMLAKYMLTRTVTALGQAGQARKQSAPSTSAPIAASAPVLTEPFPQPASAVDAETASGIPPSAPASTNM